MTIKVGDKIKGAQWDTLPVGSIGRYHNYPESYIKTEDGNFFVGEYFGTANVAGYTSPIIVVEYINGEVEQAPTNTFSVGDKVRWDKTDRLPLGTLLKNFSNVKRYIVTSDGLGASYINKATGKMLDWDYVMKFKSTYGTITYLPESK